MEEGARWWLRYGGLARRITPAGVLIGRSPHCDIVIASERVSRRQALVHLASKGPMLEVLGRAATKVGGEVVERSVQLEAGCHIELPETKIEVWREAHQEPRSVPPPPVWVLEGPSGALFGVVDSPFSVGGGQDDDVNVPGWPHGALSFRTVADGRLELTPSVSVSFDGEPLTTGKAVHVSRGSAVMLAGSQVRVVTGGRFATESTAGDSMLPAGSVSAVRLEFLPRGGRLKLEWSGGVERAVYLADRRCDLVAALLKPPAPFAPGDFIDDEVLLGRVWQPGQAGRTNLNVLLHRVRKDLARAGLDDAAIERSEGGGATRFVLLPSTRVEVE